MIMPLHRLRSSVRGRSAWPRPRTWSNATRTSLEAGERIGASVAQWAHVRLFSPWRCDIDPAAAARLGAPAAAVFLETVVLVLWSRAIGVVGGAGVMTQVVVVLLPAGWLRGRP